MDRHRFTEGAVLGKEPERPYRQTIGETSPNPPESPSPPALGDVFPSFPFLARRNLFA